MQLPLLGIRLEGWLTMLAIILGPILAVQVEKYLQRKRGETDRKLRVFKELMATRGTRLAPRHVEALNMIDLEFGADVDREKPVVEAWRTYRDALSIPGDQPEPYPGFYANRDGLLVTLLYEMSKAVGYSSFDTVKIKRDGYAPFGHGKIEEEVAEIRRGMVEVVAGRRPIAITPVAPPQPAALPQPPANPNPGN
jgi:hypothetical protein